MKIAFICGSIEAGRDGVGDYLRLLAAEVQSQDWHVTIIAINDKHLPGGPNDDMLEEAQSQVKVFRIPANFSSTKRFKIAGEILHSQNPDWISLQFVPYAYSGQGLPFKLAGQLAGIQNSGAKWHLMVHESYLVGKLSFKNKLVGEGQKMIMKSLVKKLEPSLVHTTNKWYQEILANISVQSESLGLFGNIPIVEAPKQTIRKPGTFQGVYFGTVPLYENFPYYLNGIDALCSDADVPFEMVICGKTGGRGDDFIAELRKLEKEYNNFSIKEMGLMEAEGLSKLFLSADFGIARVVPRLLGKSGTAIAILEHGLPLWVPTAPNREVFKEVFDFKPEACYANLCELYTEAEPFPRKSRLPEIARRLMDQMKAGC
jgi:hypothetical protein